MTRTISANLNTHIQGEVTTLATLWLLTRVDATVMGFTDHDQDITYNSVLYKSATGFVPSDVALKRDFSVSNLDVAGVLDSTSITEADIAAGLYDYAEISIFKINYESVADGVINLKRGWMGEISRNKGRFIAEVRGLSQAIQQTIGEIYLPSCSAILGDTKCKVVLSGFTISTTVTTVTSNQVFISSALSQASGWFTGGEVQWTSGLNNGLKMEVKEFANTQVSLAIPMPFTIAASDSYNIIAGCDKTSEVCKSKFSNLVNFRGFPDVPGMDQLLETAGTFKA